MRRATRKDASSIAAVYRDAENAVRAQLGLAPLRSTTLEAWFAGMLDADGDDAFFAEEHGFVQLAGDSLSAIYVAPPAWGTGVATRLHAIGLDHLRAGGVRLARLIVIAANARARRFYEREGWRLAGDADPLDFDGVSVPFAAYERALGHS